MMPRGSTLDHDFICNTYQRLRNIGGELRAADWADIEFCSGLSRASLESIAAAYARSNATIVSYGMGITQHLSGTSNVQQIANLLLLQAVTSASPARASARCAATPTSKVIAPSAFRSSPALRCCRTSSGHSVSSRPVSTDTTQWPRWRRCSTDAPRCSWVWEATCRLRCPILTSASGQCATLDFAAHVATKLNRSHLLIGKDSVVLPCLGRTEEDVQAGGPQSITVEDSMSMVHASRGKLPPASPHLLSEPVIVSGIAQATLPDSRVPWSDLVADYDRIRDRIEAVFPEFEDYNARIRHPGGFRLPLHATERVWKTASGRAEFLLPSAPPAAACCAANALLLTTIRSHDQYNTTIYSSDDRYRGVFGRRDVVFMNQGDLADHGLAHGDLVDIETALPSCEHLRLSGFTAVAYDIARGSVAAYYPEANCLVPLNYQDKQSGTPAYKSVPVKITRQARQAT